MRTRRILRKGLALFLALFLLPGSLSPAEESAAGGDVPAGSLQLDTRTWNQDLHNLRLLKEGRYVFRQGNSRYGLEGIVPNEQGLGNLYISGSEEFSLPQFLVLAETLRAEADGREIWIIDLRRESHAMMGSVPVFWNVGHNEGNRDLSAEQIEKDEVARFAPLVGQTLKTGRHGNREIPLTGLLTEKELVESAGFRYYRLPITDHTWPRPEQIDEFIRFAKELDPDQVWLHFHCRAGQGRTGIMMILYDKMRNPDIPITDIAVRQAKLGAGYPLYVGDSDGWEAPLYAEKARMTPLLGRYVEENWRSGFQVSWSDWLKEHDPDGTNP